MRELLDGAVGERLERADYLADFDRHFWSIGEPGFWKLQRQQYHREPGYDSWEAFARGDWDESLRLLEAGRAQIAEEHRRVDAHGFSVRWVRVVEEPLTPYLQWELNVLRVRAECGSVVRVIRPHQVAALEAAGPLPELHTLGGSVMYQVIYGEDGALAGALRYKDAGLVARCQRVIADLHASGEPLADYFEREVAGLKPPAGDQ